MARGKPATGRNKEKNLQRQPESQDKIFPYISASPYVWIMMSVFLMFTLFIGKGGVIGEAPDPVSTFLFGWFFLSQISFTGIQGFTKISQAVGLSTPVKGYNIILAALGIGSAVMVYSVFNQIAAISQQASIVSTLVNPLYNPYTTLDATFAITTDWTGFISSAVYNFGVVGLFEELYKVILIKNIANWLYAGRGWGKNAALGVGILGAFSVWGSWHFVASWEPSIAAIFSSITFGLIFYSSWMIADFVGALGEAGTIVLTSILLVPSWMSHGTWNTLQATGGTGLTFAAEFGLGFSLFTTSIISLFLIRQRFRIMSNSPLNN